MKKIISVGLALALAGAPAAAFGEGEDVKVYLNDAVLKMEDADGNTVTPVIIDGTTYLPLRAIATALGLDVSWDGDTRSVYLEEDGGEDVVASDAAIFGNLEHYVSNPYEILGTSVFLNPLKELLGKDYDAFSPAFATTYVSGTDERITLHCSDTAVVDVYKNGRIDAAMLSPKDESFGGANVVKYYSSVSPDGVDSPGIVEFISQNASLSGYTAIEFVKGKGAPSSVSGTYTDVNGFGSFTFTPGKDNEPTTFKGAIKGSPRGNCSTGGTIVLAHGCTVCIENNAPSILFAFSGDRLTVIGLNTVTKALTTVYKK